MTGLGFSRGNSFYAKLQSLEDDWTARPAGGSPQERAELAWRADVLACLHIVRDLGNRIHADSDVGQAEVDRAHAANRRLLEAILRVGPLDATGSAGSSGSGAEPS